LKFSKVILSVISGILLALAFPKFNLYLLAWVALVPFFIALTSTRNLKESLFYGFVFSVVFFGIHLFWINSLFRFVSWWVVFGWAALVLFQTLFILFYVILFRFNPQLGGFTSDPFQPEVNALIGGWRRPSRVGSVIKTMAYVFIGAVLWVFVEWLRAWGPFGVTGGDLGYSQVKFLPLIQIASFSSVYGVSFIIVLFNISLALFIVNIKKWMPLLISVALIILSIGYGMQVMNINTVEKGTSMMDVLKGTIKTAKIALIQPNISQDDKLDVAKINATFNKHISLTRKAVRSYSPDVVVWPETAIFTFLAQDPILFPKVKNLLMNNNIWLITGTPYYKGKDSYNSIVSISPQGEVDSRYDKSHAVPFGEYLPFRSLLYPLLKGVGYYDGEFSRNSKPKPIYVNGSKIAAAICFESTFPNLIKKRVEKDSSFILVLTNDAWFGNSSALYFHINTGVFRAIENRKYFIQVGNSGVTAIIDPYGRVLKRTKVNEEGILTFEIPLS
jgi:apolipoprotein N-acyltransferase